MPRRYLTIAVRQLLAQKLCTAINVAVLALAVALLTVAVVATLAARAKPVAALRYE